MNKEYIKEIAKELKMTEDQAIWWWKWFLENNEEHEVIKRKEVEELTQEELEIVIEDIRKRRKEHVVANTDIKERVTVVEKRDIHASIK